MLRIFESFGGTDLGTALQAVAAAGVIAKGVPFRVTKELADGKIGNTSKNYKVDAFLDVNKNGKRGITNYGFKISFDLQ